MANVNNMNFRRGRQREELEINLIPMIDVLLVILIFLMVTTTFSQFAELQINLPTAQAEKPEEKPAQENSASQRAVFVVFVIMSLNMLVNSYWIKPFPGDI